MAIQSAVYTKSYEPRNGNGSRVTTVTTGNFSATSPILVTGRNAAHARRDASMRAGLAGQWVLSEVELAKPTIIQAAAVFRVSVPYVRVALELKEDTRGRVAKGELSLSAAANANGLLTAWLNATPDEQAALGAIVGVGEIWDRAIDPSL